MHICKHSRRKIVRMCIFQESQAVRARDIVNAMRAIMLNLFIVLCVRLVTAASVLEAVGVTV